MNNRWFRRGTHTAWIGVIGLILAALVGGVFVLFNSSDIEQTVHCGSAVNNVEGNVTIQSQQDCKEITP